MHQNGQSTALLEEELIKQNVIKICSSSSGVAELDGHQYQVDDKNQRNGVLNQILLTAAIWIAASSTGMPIGFSSVLLPQLVVDQRNVTNTNLTMPSPAAVQSNLIGAPDQETMCMNIELGSWISSVHSLATPIGSFISSPFTDRYGRKTAIQVSIIPLIISWVIMALSQSHYMIIVARIFGGIGTGFLASPAQIFIAEIAEPHLRGMLIGSPFVAYSLGILIVYALGWKFSWRLVAWACTLLPFLSLIALFFANESPVWLVRNRKKEEAFRSMKWLRRNDQVAKEEVNDLVERFDEEKRHEQDQTLWQIITQKDVIKPLVIVNLFNTFQNLSGTLTIVFYAVQIIEEFTNDSATIDRQTAALWTAVCRLIITIIYCYILMVVSRRKMVNWAGSASAISSFLLGLLIVFKHQLNSSLVFYAAGVLLLVYLGGSTCLFIMCGVGTGELLPSKVRGKLSGYIFAYMNVVLFILVKIFPSFVKLVGISGLFFSFSLGSLLATLIMYLMMPETKGVKLTDIEDYFKGNHWLWNEKYLKNK